MLKIIYTCIKNILPVTGFPLASVTGTATGATVVTNCVTGFPLPSKEYYLTFCLYNFINFKEQIII